MSSTTATSTSHIPPTQVQIPPYADHPEEVSKIEGTANRSSTAVAVDILNRVTGDLHRGSTVNRGAIIPLPRSSSTNSKAVS